MSCQRKKNKLKGFFKNLDIPFEPTLGMNMAPGYGFYHIGRVAYFTCTLQRDMYITYRMLVRINQFLLMLSFRIQLSIRKWLHDYGMKHNRLQDSWQYDFKKVKAEIATREKQHKKDMLLCLSQSQDFHWSEFWFSRQNTSSITRYSLPHINNNHELFYLFITFILCVHVVCIIFSDCVYNTN